MTLGIMQPYFFPYLGYFQLINAVDKFILFDTSQFIRHGWIERNQILNQNGHPIYFKIPLKKHSRNTLIKDIIILNSEKWKEKILAQLVSYKKKAPNYWKVISLLKNIFEFESDNLVEINYNSLRLTCNYLNINTPISVWSQHNKKIEEVNSPDEWALNICKTLGASKYYNPIGGISFFNRTKYKKTGIELKFIRMNDDISYKQFSNEFIPNLSIIDVMMFNSAETINKLLMEFELL